MTPFADGAMPGTLERLHGVVSRVLGRMTKQVVVATTAIALALQAWTLYEAAVGNMAPPASIYTSLIIVNVAIAFSMTITTFVADEFVAAGARPIPAYGSAILLGSALGSLAQWFVHEILRATLGPVPGLQADRNGMFAVFVFFEYMIWGTIAVWIYLNRRGEMRARARMNASRVLRAQTQRRALEAQLQALQAQVEPRFLLDTLASIRDRYASDAGAGSAALGALIAYLRSVLPQLRASSSHLTREVDLVRSYLDVMRASATAVDFDATMPAALATARMPPMVLLPLVNLAVRRHPQGRRCLIRVGAHGEHARLRVTVSCACDCLAKVAEDRATAPIRERLRALYGTEGTLGVLTSGGRTSVTVDIPLESTDSRHR